MMPVGLFWDEIFDILSADPEMEITVKRRTNYEYFNLCRRVSWEALRAPFLTIDFAGQSSGGQWVPSDLYGIDLVWDDDDEVEFFAKDEAAAQVDEHGYRYYLNAPSRAHYFEGTDLQLERGASSFTSAALTADASAVDGEYVQFASEPGFYKITSDTTPFTIEPTYYGPDLLRENFRIRPWESTKKLVIQDPDEDELLDRDVLVYYWRAPVPLYRDEDVILVPAVEYLKLKVLRGIWQAKDRYPVSQRMMDDAFREGVKQNVRFSRTVAPRDQHFAHFELDDNPFTGR